MKNIRAGGIAALTVVAALLAGCSAPAPAETASSSHSASPTPTPTAAPAPTARVPLTCDQLVPPAVVAAAFRAPVTPVTTETSLNPASYADERAGALRCTWGEGDPAQSAAEKQLYGWVTVVPGVTREGFEDFRTGIDVGGFDEPLGTEPDTYSMCPQNAYQLCGFFALTPDYAVQAGIWDYGAATHETQSAWVEAVSAAALPAVRALHAPVPLWQPAGPTLRGAQDCDGLITEADIGSVIGQEVSPVRADGGENALSTLGINRVVHSYWCAWSTKDSSGVSAAVLPGGAVYALKTRPPGAVDVTGVGDSAYRSGTTLDVIASGGWVQVQGGGAITEEQVTAIAKQVLVNVGYTG